MIRKKTKTQTSRLEIDLTGPQGNVFYLMGCVPILAEKLNLDPDEIISEMMSSDYENAVLIFEKYFGKYVILYR